MHHPFIKQTADRVVYCLSFCLIVVLALTSADATQVSSQDWERLHAGDVVIQSKKIDGQHRIEAAIVIASPVDDIWKVMLDCPNAPLFVPNMRRCEVIERADDASWEIIEHEIKYNWLAPTTIYQFKAEYIPQELIHFERISGDLTHLVGDWKLISVQGHSDAVLVQYSVYINPGFFVPKFMTRRALRKDVPDILRALRDRVQSLQDANTDRED